MGDLIKCDNYDASANKCKAGHIQIMPLCWGSVSPGCPSCGHTGLLPQCLKEDPPAHLIREDGFPLAWPDKDSTHE